MDPKLLNETIESIADLLDTIDMNQTKARAYLNKNIELSEQAFRMVGRLMDLRDNYRTPENWKEQN
jgi:isoleucyl-tRNA synthetase